MTAADENIGQTIPLTEAEYAAYVKWRMNARADELNEVAAAFLPPGVHFEWTTKEPS